MVAAALAAALERALAVVLEPALAAALERALAVVMRVGLAVALERALGVVLERALAVVMRVGFAAVLECALGVVLCAWLVAGPGAGLDMARVGGGMREVLSVAIRLPPPRRWCLP